MEKKKSNFGKSSGSKGHARKKIARLARRAYAAIAARRDAIDGGLEVLGWVLEAFGVTSISSTLEVMKLTIYIGTDPRFREFVTAAGVQIRRFFLLTGAAPHRVAGWFRQAKQGGKRLGRCTRAVILRWVRRIHAMTRRG